MFTSLGARVTLLFGTLVISVLVFSVLMRERFATVAFEELTTDGPAIVVVLQPDECSGFMKTVDLLRVVSEQTNVPVIVLPIGLPRGRAARSRAMQTMRLPFPFAVESAAKAEAMIARFGYLQTPIVMLLGTDGKPRIIIPPTGLRRAQIGGIEALATYARVL